MSDGVTKTTIKLKKTAKTVVISCPEQLDITVVNELHGLLNEQIEQCATSKATIKLDAKQGDKRRCIGPAIADGSVYRCKGAENQSEVGQAFRNIDEGCKTSGITE